MSFPSVVEKPERLLTKPLRTLGHHGGKAVLLTVVPREMSVPDDRQRDIVIVQRQPLNPRGWHCAAAITAPPPDSAGRWLPAFIGHICHCSHTATTHASAREEVRSAGGWCHIAEKEKRCGTFCLDAFWNHRWGPALCRAGLDTGLASQPLSAPHPSTLCSVKPPVCHEQGGQSQAGEAAQRVGATPACLP